MLYVNHICPFLLKAYRLRINFSLSPRNLSRSISKGLSCRNRSSFSCRVQFVVERCCVYKHSLVILVFAFATVLRSLVLAWASIEGRGAGWNLHFEFARVTYHESSLIGERLSLIQMQWGELKKSEVVPVEGESCHSCQSSFG